VRLGSARPAAAFQCIAPGVCAAARMQMGPALLPTPLSPARGYPVPCKTSGGPSASLVSGHTWRPMSGSARPIFRLVSCDWRIRVSSPALAPASGFCSCPAAFLIRPKASISAAMHSCLAETVFLCRSVPLRVGAFAFPLLCSSARLLGLSGETASRPSQTSLLAFGRSLFQAISR
jgi:hypothetical protein